MSQLPCSLTVLSPVSMSPSAYCLIAGSQVQVLQPFYSKGYVPLSDGPLQFTLNSAIVNSESNALYGSFLVGVYDQGSLIASGTFVSAQSIVPITMTYTQTRVLQGGVVKAALLSGDQGTEFSL